MVFPKNWLDEGRDKLISFAPEKPFSIVPGGDLRQDSVAAGLDAIKEKEGWVIIHDGARPGITPELVTLALQQARLNGNAVCAIPSTDTLVRVVDGELVEAVNRQEIYRLQTPQIFRLSQMRQAIENARKNKIKGTDDSSLVRALGQKIHLVEGSDLNSKVTRSEDLEMMESLL
jgi:2-C-methyl-D-erythritol 4-phosphate cytidylyltransferase